MNEKFDENTIEEGRQLSRKASAWDYIISEWRKGRFPNLSKFLTGGRVVYSEIDDISPFAYQGGNETIERYETASRFVGCVCVESAVDSICLRVYYIKEFGTGLFSLLVASRLGLLKNAYRD